MGLKDDIDAVLDKADSELSEKALTISEQATQITALVLTRDELTAKLQIANEMVGSRDTEITALKATISTLEQRIRELENAHPKPQASPDLFFRLAEKDELVRPNFAFDHAWPFFWESKDNRAYTDPTGWYPKNFLPVQGENGKHAAYGGAIRNILQNNAPYPTTGAGWMRNMVADSIRTKIKYGLGGSFMNLITVAADHAQYYNAYRDEANANFPDFKVVPTVDATGSITSNKATLATTVASFLQTRNALVINDKLIVGSFAANKFDRVWWADLATRLKAIVGKDIAFVHVINGGLDAQAIKDRDQIAIGHWEGGADPLNYARNYQGEAELVRSTGTMYLASIEAQNVRPRQYLFDESVGNSALIAAWDRAIKDNADFAQLVTWQDLWEGTEFAPSTMRGTVPLEINAYKMTEWLTGKKPEILEDYIAVAYRNQLANAMITGPGATSRRMEKWGRSQSPFSDKVEIRTMLTAPDKVTISVGGFTTTYDAPAGEFQKLVDPHPGKVILSTGRGERIDSPILIRASSGNQDRGYAMVSNFSDLSKQYDPTPAA